MSIKDFSKEVLHTIEREQIAPRPRWIFFVRQLSLLGGLVFSILIGGISVSVLLFSIADIDPAAERMMRMHPGPFFITYLPYAWILTLVAFGIVAYYDLRNIKGAYRYRTATLLGVSLFSSIIVGSIFHAIGAGKFTERQLVRRVPRYQELDARKERMWMRPNEGMLAGQIMPGPATSSCMLYDFSGQRWTVEVSDSLHQRVSEGFFGERVRIIGDMVRPGVFRATEIFPWGRASLRVRD